LSNFIDETVSEDLYIENFSTLKLVRA